VPPPVRCRCFAVITAGNEALHYPSSEFVVASIPIAEAAVVAICADQCYQNCFFLLELILMSKADASVVGARENSSRLPGENASVAQVRCIKPSTASANFETGPPKD
jgi:hypothetical protein